ncbi:cation transport protein-domain-containing protein [Chlamydoabsidia padenii]|nr:cation transport protein-domain-containing protein [Chlamydoabsidia padenii]
MSALQSLFDRAHRFKNNHIHFLQVHYVYILFTIFIFSGLYFCQPGTSWAYIDVLYMATTGCTNTGLNTIPLSAMSTYQVSVLYFSSLFGSHIVVSFVMVMVRKYYFSKRFREVVLFNKARKARETHRRRQSNNSSKLNDRPIINVLLHSGTNIGHDDQLPSLKMATFDLEAGVIGPYPLTMPLKTQHKHHLQKLQPGSQITPVEKSANDIVASFYHNQQEQELDMEKDNFTQDTTTTTTTGKSPQFDHQQTGYNDTNNQTDDENLHYNTNHSPTATVGANIIFADNVLQQREAARQRLEAQRKLEDVRQDSDNRSSYTDNHHHQHQRHHSNGDMDNQGNITDAADILSLAELTREQRYHLGGAEYRALDLLTIVIPSYYMGIVLCASFAFRIYIAVSPYAQHVLLTTNGNEGSINSWYLSFFISLSAMNNLGLSQIDASMVPFQKSPFPLLLCGFLVLAGNTAYPIFLRFTIWCLYCMTPKSYSMHRETLRYLLDHPRRCYTTLFPSAQTWWLLAILIAINMTEVVVFISTNFWLPVMDNIPIASQLLDALFQGIATRNAGFSVVNLGLLNPGTILVYIVAMYIGVYPVAISMRNSNVYQERSLGMYRTEADQQDTDDYSSNHELANGGIILKLRKQRTINSVVTTSKKIFQQPDFFVMTQIHRQLSKDICWVVVGIFCVCVLEAQAIMSPPPVTFASVIYECVSAFGCVGGSFGGTIPGTSQSKDYRTISKLVIILLMYRGRHRGLPDAIDRAVLLPSEQLEQSDIEEKQLHRLHRSSSCLTTLTGGGITSTNHSTNIRIYRRSDTL